MVLNSGGHLFQLKLKTGTDLWVVKVLLVQCKLLTHEVQLLSVINNVLSGCWVAGRDLGLSCQR